MALNSTTGDPGAQSYASVQDFEDHVALYQLDDQLAEAKIESLLIEATSYLDNRFSGQWKGSISNIDQALSWPRVGVVDSEGREVSSLTIPSRLIESTVRLAYLANTTKLISDTTSTITTSGAVLKVGPITIEDSAGISSSSVGSIKTPLTYIEGLLKNGSSSYNKIVRC